MKFYRKKRFYLIVLLLAALAVYILHPGYYPVYRASGHYSPETQTFYNTPPTAELDNGGTRRNMWAILFDGGKFRPPSPLPVVKPDWRNFEAAGQAARLVWFGHSSWAIRMGGKTLLVDPVWQEYAAPIPVMMKRFQPPPVALDELPEVDAVIYSHNHYDHLDEDVVRYYAGRQTAFYVPLGMEVLLERWGVPAERIVSLDWWQSVQVGGIRLTAVPARHSSARGMYDKNMTLWCGWVLQTPQEKIYYSGDSSYGSGNHFRAIGEAFGGFDLALIENGQYAEAWYDNHMMPEQTIQAALDVRTARFMPVHWGAYPLSVHAWDEPVRLSIPLARQKGLATLTPKMGEVFGIESPSTQWWLEVGVK